MRILYVTADLPWPLTSGYLRHYHFLRALGQRHDVTLLTLMGPTHSPSDVAALERIVARVVTEPATRGHRPFSVKVADRLRMVVAGGDTAAVRLGEAGGRLAETVPFDVLLLSGKRTMPVLDGLPPLPLVADLCDATSIRIRRQMRHAPLIDQPALALEYVEIRRVERALTHRARHAIFASARDRSAVVGAAATRSPDISPASVVPNGVDLDIWRRERRELGRDEIVFTGAMDYPPNADAAVQLVERVLPLVRREVPSARATIVGRDPTPRVQALADHDGVTVTGYVDHVRPYLERASVFVAPIRYGAGIQNKVLEALAMEVPVVASPLAADGLRTQDGDVPPVAVTRGPTAMAEQVIARLRDAAAGATADPALRAYVATHFDWTTNADRLEAILVDAAAGGDGSADGIRDADDPDDVDAAGIPA